MSSSSNTTPVAQTPTKKPTKKPTKTPTVIGRGMDGPNTINYNCHHDWILRSHPTIPYTALFCQNCDIEKR